MTQLFRFAQLTLRSQQKFRERLLRGREPPLKRNIPQRVFRLCGKENDTIKLYAWSVFVVFTLSTLLPSQISTSLCFCFISVFCFSHPYSCFIFPLFTSIHPSLFRALSSLQQHLFSAYLFSFSSVFFFFHASCPPLWSRFSSSSLPLLPINLFFIHPSFVLLCLFAFSS